MQALAQTREMDQLGQEVHELREEVTTLRAEVEKLTNLVSSLMATRDQTSRPQQPRQQAVQQPTAQNQAQKTSRFGPNPVKYAELFSTLLRENLIQTRLPPPLPKKLSTWYKPDLFCAFHQGAPGHDIEHCFAFKTVVQELIRANTLSPEGQLLVQQRPQHYPAYQQNAAITPTTDATQPPNHQHHQPQYPPQHPQQHYPQPCPQQQPYQQRPHQQQCQQYQPQPYQQQQPQPQSQQITPIHVKYADLLPQLLEQNLVQTKAPPPVPARLPAWYRPDLFCDFHRGALGHDIEHCHAMKNAVRSLIRTNSLTF